MGEIFTWFGGVFLLRCRVGAASPRRDLSGLTSGVLLVLLFEDPEMEAWTDATTLAWSGGTYLWKGFTLDTIKKKASLKEEGRGGYLDTSLGGAKVWIKVESCDSWKNKMYENWCVHVCMLEVNDSVCLQHKWHVEACDVFRAERASTPRLNTRGMTNDNLS